MSRTAVNLARNVINNGIDGALNTSGIRPMEYKLLVLPDEVASKTAGGVLLPDVVKDKEQFAQQDATVIEVSPFAFNFESEWPADYPKPRAGDRVSYARFAGAKKVGKDGKEYRIINDRDVFAVIS